VTQPLRSRGRNNEPWERGLYLLLLIVALVVILYSLIGIATLLGYLPLSQHNGGGRKEVRHPAMEARRSVDPVQHRLPTTNVAAEPCPPRAPVKVVAVAPATGVPTFEPARPACVELPSDYRTVRNAAAPALANERVPRTDNGSGQVVR
jgi:hypothetical protein